MGSVLRLSGISVLVTLAACAAPADARPQDASGRPTTAVQDDTGRPPKPKKPRPKKVIRAKPDVADKTPTSSVIIRSYPPGADVFVDGKDVGTTADDGELELADVKLGAHRIVLRKEGYREWGQTVTLKASDKPEEIEPLLQSENPQYMRDIGKMPAIDFGKEVAGRVTRDSVASRDGKTFYNEYVMKVDDPDAYVVVLRAKGSSPTLRLVDDSNVPYSIEKVGDDVYQTVFVPHPGFYYVQVIAPLDESTFTSGDYTLRVIGESDAHAENTVSVGATVDGELDVTDRQASPGDYYDVWAVAGDAGSQVRIKAATDGGFTPVLTLFQDGKVVATSADGAKDSGKKKKKKGDAPAESAKDAAEIVTTLTGGGYKVFVRSASEPKVGAYKLSVTMGG